MRTLVTAQEMAAFDRRAIDELLLPGRTLMETAGRMCADVVAQHIKPPARIAIVCGIGNNGGDGFVAARALYARGYRPKVFIVGPREKIKGDALAALTTLERSKEAPIEPLINPGEQLRDTDLIVDALLGTGLKGAVREPFVQAVNAINSADLPVIAVDLPSGLCADTGRILGCAVKARATATFAFAKRGHYLYPGRALCGVTHVYDIGIPARYADDAGIKVRLVSPGDGPSLIPKRPRDAHKGDFGHVVAMAGSARMPGAAVLTTTGALRAGAGRISLAISEEALVGMPHRPAEIMLRLRGAKTADAWVEQLSKDATAIIAGPGLGLGEQSRADVEALLENTDTPLCLDADALSILAENDDLWKNKKSPWVLTPHPKEMARLSGLSTEEIQADRIAAAQNFATQKGCTVLLKGAGSVVAGPDGDVYIIDAGNPGLATGGSGDVLAGIVGAFLARGLEPPYAACAAALLHAKAADQAIQNHGEAGLRPSDVIEAMGEVFAAWQR